MEMTGYTKLFGSIVASTIWREPHTVRIVWITMLAMANKSGVVEASVPGLADLSRVTLDECKVALAALMAPDEYSRTSEAEGRRIEPTDGGWKIINHAKYRAKMGVDEKREYFRKKKQEQRAVSKSESNNVKDCPPSSTESRHAEAQSQSDSKADVPPAVPLPQRPRRDAVEEITPNTPLLTHPPLFTAFWKEYPRKVGKEEAFRAWKKFKCDTFAGKIMDAIASAKQSDDWRKDAGQFIPHPATWLNRGGWDDDFNITPAARKAPEKVTDPAGWREWVSSRKLDYVAFRDALPYMREEFEKWQKENP